jgi:hypothetical protein
VLRECKCENNIVTGPSRSAVKLLSGLNRVGLCEHGNEHRLQTERKYLDKISDRQYMCKYGATLQNRFLKRANQRTTKKTRKRNKENRIPEQTLQFYDKIM